MLLLALVGCGSDGDSGDGSSPDGNPVDGGTLTFLHPYDSNGYDPAVMSFVNSVFAPRNYAIFDALAVENPNTAGVDLRLLESADSDDSIKWTLALREGVEFSDGTPFNAEAIKFNWERLADPATETVQAAVAQRIKSMKVVDELTLEVVLATADGQFPRTIATSALTYIGSPTALKADPDGFNKAPVGAGAFTLSEWVPDSRAKFVRNPGYYGDVHLDQLVIKVVPDETQRLNTLRSGGGDAMFTSSPVAAADAAAVGSLDVASSAPANGYVIFFNMRRAPFDNLKARQAFALALEGEELTALFGDTASPANNMFLPGTPFHDEAYDQPKGDNATAQRLFDELAEESGGPLEVTFLTIPNFEQQAEWFQAKLAGFENVEIEIETVQVTEYTARYTAGDFSAGFHTFTAVDPDGFYQFLHSEGTANYMGFSDPAVDAAFEEGRVSRDEDARVEAYDRMQEKVVEEVPWRLYQRQTSWNYFQPTVHGLSTETLQTYAGVPMWDEIWVDS